MATKPQFHAERGESMRKERKESAAMEKREKRAGVERPMNCKKLAKGRK